jgi:hypothetical protein
VEEIMPLFVVLMLMAPYRIVTQVSDHREGIGPDEILQFAIAIVVSVVLGYFLSLFINRLHGGPEPD